MKKISTFYFLLFSLTFFACGKKDNGTYNYSTLSFDTSNTFIFTWDSTVHEFPNFSEPLALNNNDIKITDSLMRDAVTKFNNANSKAYYKAYNEQVPIDSFIIDVLKYKRQLFPYKDNNGKKIIYLISFSRLFPEWRKRIYYGGTGTGFSEFRIKINLSDTSTTEFSIGGFG